MGHPPTFLTLTQGLILLLLLWIAWTNYTWLGNHSLAHFPMIAGVIYLALGIEQVLADLSHGRRAAGAPLGWTSVLALYGGTVLYLAGRAATR